MKWDIWIEREKGGWSCIEEDSSGLRRSRERMTLATIELRVGSPEPDELEVVLAACQDWCWCWVGHVCDGIGVGADAEGCRSEVRVREIEMLRLCWHQSETTERDGEEVLELGRKGLELKYRTNNFGWLNFLQFFLSEKDLQWPVTALVTDSLISQFSVV